MAKLPRALLVLGAAILLLTAAFHGLGVSAVSSALGDGNVNAELARIVAGLWLFFCWHLAALAAPAVWIAARGQVAGRLAIAFCAAVAAVDFVWVLTIAGLFLGTAMLLGAACCLALGAWTMTPRE